MTTRQNAEICWAWEEMHLATTPMESEIRTDISAGSNKCKGHLLHLAQVLVVA